MGVPLAILYAAHRLFSWCAHRAQFRVAAVEKSVEYLALIFARLERPS